MVWVVTFSGSLPLLPSSFPEIQKLLRRHKGGFVVFYCVASRMRFILSY